MTGPTTRGSCLCGAVRYEFSGEAKAFRYCFCSRCRKSTGSAHAANVVVPADRFRWIAGEDKVRRYEHAEARRFNNFFCGECGSKLPWLTRDGRWAVVTAGTLDDDPGLRPEQAIHWASRANWYVPRSDLPTHDELPE